MRSSSSQGPRTRPHLKVQGVELEPSSSAGVLLAVVLGAAPAALMGLDVAWIVVASGASALLLAPILALRQVRAIPRLTGPSSLTVHAGRSVDLRLQLEVTYPAHGVLLSLHGEPERGRSVGEPSTTDGAPRLALNSVSAAARGTPVDVDVPLRLAVRGRYGDLFAHLSSSFPLGLVTARTTLPLSTNATALPRTLRPKDPCQLNDLRALLRGHATAEVMCRARGQGSPATLRPAREGDTARDLDLRASFRRQQWIAVERTQLAALDLEVVLVCTAWDEEEGSESRRGQGAFESATSLAAAVVLTALGEGLGVTLSLAQRAQPPWDAGEVSRGSRALPHLLALTDAHYGGRSREGDAPRAAADRSGARILIAPIIQLNRAAVSPPAGFDLCLLVDPHGRSRRTTEVEAQAPGQLIP